MKKSIMIIISIMLTLLVILSGCTYTGSEKKYISTVTPENGEIKIEYIRITAEEAKEWMNESKDHIILDVRTEAEFAEGHIEGAVLLPSNEIISKAEGLLPDKDQLILVYCRSGNRSTSASMNLIKLGYTKVIDFGGILDWPYGTVK